MPPVTAQLFATDGVQAVKLPAEFRFEDRAEVYIRRDENTGDVILSTIPRVDWSEFMRLRHQLGHAAESASPCANRAASNAIPSKVGRNDAVHAGHQCRQRSHPGQSLV